MKGSNDYLIINLLVIIISLVGGRGDGERSGAVAAVRAGDSVPEPEPGEAGRLAERLDEDGDAAASGGRVHQEEEGGGRQLGRGSEVAPVGRRAVAEQGQRVKPSNFHYTGWAITT